MPYDLEKRKRLRLEKLRISLHTLPGDPRRDFSRKFAPAFPVLISAGCLINQRTYLTAPKHPPINSPPPGARILAKFRRVMQRELFFAAPHGRRRGRIAR